MRLEAFREKIKYYRLLTSFSQKDLAQKIGIHPVVFSSKLNGAPRYNLTEAEIKLIIKTLVEWKALTKQSEVLELLDLAVLKPYIFKEQEWYAFPLNRLEKDALSTILAALEVTGYTNRANATVSEDNAGKPKKLPEISAAKQDFTPQLPPHNIPAQLTKLIGRQNEIKQLQNLLEQADVRLLTLTGPGGVGKTRLASQVGVKLLEDFEHGVFFVSLVPLRDTSLLAATIANTFGLKSSGTTPVMEVLKRYLSSKHLLLILDNFEHLGEAAPLVTELLNAAPKLKILTTSRILLQVYGEHNYTVPTLGLPDLDNLNTLDNAEMLAGDAIALFTQRAQAVRPNFGVADKTTVWTIVQICRLLDGLPLAIELAAARCRLFTPQQLLNRLKSHSRLNELTSGARDKPQHQQTLASTIEWSYILLEPREKVLLMHLAIFSDSASLEAIQNICAPAENNQEVEECLESLINKSLVQLVTPAKEAKHSQPLRFGMLETIREYALLRLVETDPNGQVLTELKNRHLAYFTNLAEAAEDDLRGAGQIERFNALKPEFYNLCAAINYVLNQFANHPAVTMPELALATNLDNAEAAGALESALKIVGSFWYFRALSDYPGEGRLWLAKIVRLVGLTDLAETAEYARATKWGAIFAITQSDYPTASEYYRESIRVSRLVGDKLTLATSLLGLGTVVNMGGKLAEACNYNAEAVELYRQTGDKAGLGRGLNNYGSLLVEQGYYQKALEVIEEGTALRREVGDKAGLANSLFYQGEIFILKTEYAKAQALFEEALSIYTEIGNKWPLSAVLHNLCNIYRLQGKFEEAQAAIDRAYQLCLEIDFKSGISVYFKYCGYLAYHRQDYSAALEHLEKCLQIVREVKHQGYLIETLFVWALVQLAVGNYTVARDSYREIIEINREARKKLTAISCLELSAKLDWLAEINFAQAIPKLATAAHIREILGVPYDPFEKVNIETIIKELKISLSAQDFNNLWNIRLVQNPEQLLELINHPDF